MTTIFDLVIIGGGINGCGCAADAASRGLSVCLIEQYDLSSQTSSKSTKLIHGGLRYLEYYEFALVKKSLDERERLLKIAPHLMHKRPFILLDHYKMRSRWMVRLGLWIYDHLGFSNTLPRSRSLTRKKDNLWFAPLKNVINRGNIYYDLATDDSRLAIENALCAKDHAAELLTYTQVISAVIKNDLWEISTVNALGESKIIKSKAIINASGPWVNLVNQRLGITNSQKLTLVKGSHIVVNQMYSEDQAYVLQQQDHRIIFTIPYHGYTLVGTTEIPYTGDPLHAEISQEEITYLLDTINTYFKQQCSINDIVYTYSGVRPLLAQNGKNATSLSREYLITKESTALPYFSIYGGKITTYRQLAEDVIDKLVVNHPSKISCNTSKNSLPGADNFNIFLQKVFANYVWLPPTLLQRYINTYGSRTDELLVGCNNLASLGYDFGYGLYQREIDFLIKEEWAKTTEDILWRRTKLGLKMSERQIKNIQQYINHSPYVVINNQSSLC